jgi:hypothetical protein
MLLKIEFQKIFKHTKETIDYTVVAPVESYIETKGCSIEYILDANNFYFDGSLCDSITVSYNLEDKDWNITIYTGKERSMNYFEDCKVSLVDDFPVPSEHPGLS